MKKMIRRLNRREGFTLAELLIVVAIIAVLVAVSIPVFTNQLEKAREATDEANIRAIYAELSAAVLTEDETGTVDNHKPADTWSVTDSEGVYTGVATYTMTQNKAGTANGQDIVVGGVTITSSNFKTGTCTITIKNDGTAPTITIG